MNLSKSFPSPTNTTESCRHVLELLIEVVLGLIVIISFPLVLLLSIPIYLFRFAVIIYANFFRKDLDDILGGISAYLVNDYFDNKSPRGNIVTPIIIRGHVTLEELKKLVKSRWIETNDRRFKLFCQYPVRWMGFTFYKKANVFSHVDNHVHLYNKLEQGTCGHVTEEDVTIFSEKLLNAPFTPLTSPWEVHLIQNYKNEKICSDSEQLSIFIFRVHHSLTDGFGITAAFVQAFSQQTLGDLKMPTPRYQKRTWWKKLTSCILLSMKLITEIGRFVFQTLRSSPWKVPDENKQWYQLSFRSELIPIQKLLEIKNAFGISLSSIMYSAISAGIQKSMHDSMDTTRKQTSDSKNSSIYCLQVVPLPGHPMSLTNHLTSTFLDLPIRKYDNPIERLHDVNSVLRSGRDSSYIPWVLPWISFIFGCQAYSILKFIFKNRTIPFGITNFPLESLHFEINGKKAIAADFLVGALDGVSGVDVLLLSYGQYIRVSATAEAAVMDREDINKFGKYMVDEIERLFLMACSAVE